MTVAVVDSGDGVGDLASDWRGLWQRTARPSPFLAPEWLLPWWQVFGGDQRPLAATLRRPDGTLAGLLPLYVSDEGKILPIGVGLSDHAGILLATDAPPDAASRLLAAALAAPASAAVGRCDIPDLPPGEALLRARCPDGWADQCWAGPPCPVLALRPEPAIPRGMRRDLRQARHRADRSGAWSITTADARSIAEAFENLVALHGARWTARDEPGVLADPRVRAFHHAALPGLASSGLARLATLTLRGRPAAVVHALRDPGRIHFYLGGFAPEAAFESPGTILVGALLEEAASDGCDEAHFLRGGEAYKYAWGATDRANTGRSLVRL